MPWNMQDLLSSASQNKRSKVLLTHGSMAEFMARGLGYEDYCVAKHIYDPIERERIRHFFIPALRRPKFGERIYNAEGGE
jgi:hypothetical protein